MWESGGAIVAKPQAFLGDRMLEELSTVEEAKSAVSPAAMGLLHTDIDGRSVKLEGTRNAVRAVVDALAPRLATA